MSFRTFANIAGTVAKVFTISKGGPTLIPGRLDPNDATVVGKPGDIYIESGGDTQKVYQNTTAGWARLSTDQMFSRTKVATQLYTASNDDYYLGSTYRAGSAAITLPPGTTNKIFVVKDETGLAAQHPVLIYPTGTDTIDGSDHFSIDVPYGSINLVYGDEWHVF